MSNYLFQYLNPGSEGQVRVNKLCSVGSFPNGLIHIPDHPELDYNLTCYRFRIRNKMQIFYYLLISV